MSLSALMLDHGWPVMFVMIPTLLGMLGIGVLCLVSSRHRAASAILPCAFLTLAASALFAVTRAHRAILEPLWQNGGTPDFILRVIAMSLQPLLWALGAAALLALFALAAGLPGGAASWTGGRPARLVALGGLLTGLVALWLDVRFLYGLFIVNQPGAYEHAGRYGAALRQLAQAAQSLAGVSFGFSLAALLIALSEVRQRSLREATASAQAVLLVLAALCVATASPARADWPGWRGPDRDGVAADLETPESWPASLEQVWQVPAGVGHASPLVVGSRVYLFARDRENDEETLTALDLANGETLWRQSYPVAFKAPMGSGRHGPGPKSTPLVLGDRIYTFGITGVFSTWSAEDGKLLRRHDFAERFKKTRPHFGVAVSPLADGDRVLAHFGGGKRGAMIAFSAEGDELWAGPEAPPSYASPVIAEWDGVRQVVTQTHDAVVGYRAEDGVELWSLPFPETMMKQNTVTPALAGRHVIVSGEGRGLMALEPRRDDAGQWQVETAWQREELPLDMSSPVASGSDLYGLTHRNKGQLFRVAAETGEPIWKGPPRTGNYASLVLAGDALLVLTADAELIVVAADAEAYEERARYEVGETPTWAHLVPVPGGVLVKEREALTLWRWAEHGPGIR